MVADSASAAGRSLKGLKIFLAEDESLIAMLMEDILEELGCEIVGSALTLKQALQQAAEVPADVAMLDINLAGDPIFPVAAILAGRNIPLIFASGYGAAVLPEEWRDRPTLPKPFSADQVEAVLGKAVGLGPV